MNPRSESDAVVDDWLSRLAGRADAIGRVAQAPALRGDFPLAAALAGLVAAALSDARRLLVVCADDSRLPEISNAIDLALRPLCLVLPAAAHASHIALRATLSLLKSRLTRCANDDSPPWRALRERLERPSSSWRDCLAWLTRGLEHEAPPRGVFALFPVCIAPWPLAERFGAAFDWVVVLQAPGLPAPLGTSWPGALCTLWVPLQTTTGPAGPLAAHDETLRLQAEIELLSQELAELELELATAQAELAAFSQRYHHLVAERLAELDRLQAALARQRAHLTPAEDELRRATERAQQRAGPSAEADQSSRHAHAPPAGFTASDELKRRFRSLAQKIHPDRARDEADRAWRHALMSEANRAYRAGDLAGLDAVFARWQAGPPGHAVAPGATFVDALRNQRAAMQRRIAAISAELDQLYGSKLYELMAASRIAARAGRDLLAEMVGRLEAQIDALRAALAANSSTA